MRKQSIVPNPIGTEQEVTSYCRAMEEFHKDGERWLVFAIPAQSGARRFGAFGCCRSSERADYVQGGAEFVA